jgi:RNA polymerase sigma-70 factor, ECF subfamily
MATTGAITAGVVGNIGVAPWTRSPYLLARYYPQGFTPPLATKNEGKCTREQGKLSHPEILILQLYSPLDSVIDSLCNVTILPVTNPSSDRPRAGYAELQDLSDEGLVQEIHCGNADAFAVIFRRFHRLVQVTALNILRDAGEAEDMTQTVFLEVYRRLKQFDPARGTFKVWLLQFAYSRSMHRRNYLFVRKFHNQVEVSAVEENANHWSPARLQAQESARLTDEVMSVLPPPQRETIKMYFFEGCTLKEIAQRRNENFSNVRHHYYRGLERLRFYLENGVTGELAGAVPSGEA